MRHAKRTVLSCKAVSGKRNTERRVCSLVPRGARSRPPLRAVFASRGAGMSSRSLASELPEPPEAVSGGDAADAGATRGARGAQRRAQWHAPCATLRRHSAARAQRRHAPVVRFASPRADAPAPQSWAPSPLTCAWCVALYCAGRCRPSGAAGLARDWLRALSFALRAAGCKRAVGGPLLHPGPRAQVHPLCHRNQGAARAPPGRAPAPGLTPVTLRPPCAARRAASARPPRRRRCASAFARAAAAAETRSAAPAPRRLTLASRLASGSTWTPGSTP